MLKLCMSFALIACLLICHNAFSSKPYSTLHHPVSGVPDVTEFFSFYCPPCYLFSEKYNVVAGINRILPADKPVAKYHISSMGKLGNELSEAWAVASIMGITDRVERALFIAVQQKNVINKAEDIYAVFNEVGISHEVYDAARNSMMVRAFIARQNALAEALQVRSTPSVYIKGRYLVSNSKIKGPTPETYAAEYTKLVAELLKKSTPGS